MRVTDRLLFESAAKHAAAARERFEAASREAATGVRVQHPEDDPGAASVMARTIAQAGRDAAIGRALGSASDELQAAETSLDAVSAALSRARELAVQLSNATYGANERAAAAEEVTGLFKDVLGRLNQKVGSRYVFGGFQDAAPPFDATGAYLGDTGVREVEVAPGVTVPASVRADVALKGAGGGVDVLGTLQSLAAALAANNVAGVQGTLDDLDTGIAQVARARSEAGSHLAVMDAARNASLSAHVDGQTRLSHLADADVIDAAARLAQAERALDAALSAAAKSFRPTLLDKL
ncbi:MAG: flagellar biosynthesis protein FlgL [Myxococcota bacterium]|jgi:flagellar hook-associated protein 3 FlgL